MHTAAQPPQNPTTRPHWRRLTPLDLKLYATCDTLTGPILTFAILFSPWAFGTTQPWSIAVMNTAGYALGILWLIKSLIRSLKNHQPPRWNSPNPSTPLLRPRHIHIALALLTLAILAYILTSAINSRSTFHPQTLTFTDHSYIPWLPHTFDTHRTWSAFWTYLGLAGAFWAVQDWILGKTTHEQRAQTRGRSLPGPLPGRLRFLLWLLAINGGLLALEGIIQRLEGSGKLLFLIKPAVNPGADTQFGPYAYRANAAQYLNLLWPVALGFWWTLHKTPGRRTTHHHALLLSATLMAASPIISTSRGGAIIALLLGALAALYLFAAYTLSAAAARGLPRSTVLPIALFLLGFLAIGLGLGWKQLKPRMHELGDGYQLREQMFDTARPMARDYPLFGTGPGTFEHAFTLYRIRTDTYWPAQLHNDWLETRITFGILGMALVLVPLPLLFIRGYLAGGLYGGRRFITLMWLALAGVLLHARYDFPFQIHSILFLTLVICSILLPLTRRA